VIGVDQAPPEPAAEELSAAEEPEAPGIPSERRPRSRLTLFNVSLALAGLLWLVDHLWSIGSALGAGASFEQIAWAPIGTLVFEFLFFAVIFYAVGWPIRWLYRLGRPAEPEQLAGPSTGEWR
jgi:hypothetical protein